MAFYAIIYYSFFLFIFRVCRAQCRNGGLNVAAEGGWMILRFHNLYDSRLPVTFTRTLWRKTTTTLSFSLSLFVPTVRHLDDTYVALIFDTTKKKKERKKKVLYKSKNVMFVNIRPSAFLQSTVQRCRCRLDGR